MLHESHNCKEDAEQALIDHLERMLETASTSKDEEKFSKAIFLLSAFFIFVEGNQPDDLYTCFLILNFLFQSQNIAFCIYSHGHH